MLNSSLFRLGKVSVAICFLISSLSWGLIFSDHSWPRRHIGQNFREICCSPYFIFTQWWKKISWTFNLRQKMNPTCFSSSPPFSLLDFFSTSDSFSGLLLSSLKLSIPRKEEFSIFAEFLDGLELLESVDWKKEKKSEENWSGGKIDLSHLSRISEPKHWRFFFLICSWSLDFKKALALPWCISY